MSWKWLVAGGWWLVVCLLVSSAMASPAYRFPPPDFTDHALPETVVPDAPSSVYDYVDLAALAVALAVASFLALSARSRRWLFGLTVVALLWFGFWRQGCVCPIGATQHVGQALADSTFTVPLVWVGFFTLPLLVALFFGRTFCAAVCPLGAVQEVTALRPVRVPRWLEHSLGLIPFVYLGLGVLFAATSGDYIICRYDPFVAFFRLSGSVQMLIFGVSLLVIGLFVGRPYCRFLCPLGALLGLCSRVSRSHVRIAPEECIHCRLCEDACPYGAIREPTVALSPEDRTRGRRRLAGLIALAPVLVAAGYFFGGYLELPLSRLDYTVQLAEQVYREEHGFTDETTDASEAFHNTGRPPAELYAEAVERRATFATAGGLFGGFVAIVVAVKLIHLSIRRRRDEYTPDPALCVSCGRCFWYCPPERVRLGLIDAVREAIPAERMPEVTERQAELAARQKGDPT